MTKPTVFLSYCHQDEAWKERISSHLRVLGDLEVWDDRKIGPGKNWFPEIEEAMDRAQVAILVISDAFLTSLFILGKEVPRLLKSRQTSGLTVIPVIARPCAWQAVDWLAAIQCYPKDGRALSKVRKAKVDEDLAALTLKVKELLGQQSSPSDRNRPDGKRFRVFLSHHSADKPAVEFLAEKLLAEGIEPFLDKWHLVPGDPWQEGLEKALDQSETCAIFLGPHGPGTWENEEMRVALDHRARSRMFRVIPILLPGTSMPDRADLPAFLSRLTWIDFRSGWQDPEEFRRLLYGIRGEAPGPSHSRLGPRVEATGRVDRPPYRGIEPFRTEDADLFYGRAALTQYLVERLRGYRFLAVLGPSGSGKSSVVRAGLIPALRQGALPGSEMWSIKLFKPGRRPLRELAAHLLRDLADPEASLNDQIERISTAMGTNYCALAAEVRRTRSQILLVVDQFEEIFTQTSSDSERQAFFANLLDASGLVSANVSVIIILRADFYARVAAYPDLADRIAARQVIVTPMLENDLWEAITKPAARSGLRFEDGLVDEILREMYGSATALPLLQQALLDLWKRREGTTLTFASYKSIHGVKGAIAGWAEAVYKNLSPAQQELACRILVELVQLGDGMEDTRRRLLQRELILDPSRATEIEGIVEHLIQNRILTTDRDPSTQEKLVEFAHEALLHEWPRLREWLEKSRADRLIRDRFQERVKVWQRLSRDAGVLARGGELDEFGRWVQNHRMEVTPAQEEYLEASFDAQDKEKKLLERFVGTTPDVAEEYLRGGDTSKVYFSGVNPLGRYLAPPTSFKQITERLFQEKWQAPPEWIMRWKREHGIDEPRRKPVLDIVRPWDLAETGWAVIFAPDVDRRVHSQLEELREYRREQATRKYSHYYRELIYRGEDTAQFLAAHGGKPGMTADPDNFPYYVLLVGSPESLPYKFQSELDVNYAVGRICFDHVEDYGSYARSVIRAEHSRPQSRDIVFFGTKHENDPATQQIAQNLVHQLADSVRESRMPWKIREMVGAKATKQQLRDLLGGAETPAFLFAACHGLGFTEDDARQEKVQGALVCQDWPGPGDDEEIGADQYFAASDMPEDGSLRGLIAFLYASYGVGTPNHDIFDQGTFGRARSTAFRALVSRLPQRLLSQRVGGALAVIGHVGPAWTPSFSGSPQGEGLGAFLYGVRRLLQGHTVGWAMEYLNQSAAALATMLGFLKEDWRHREEVDRELLAQLWLLRNDAQNFMVFGDPAVRLPGIEPR